MRIRVGFTPNTYRIEGDSAYIDLYDKSGRVACQARIDLADLPAVLAFGRWARVAASSGRNHYARCLGRRMSLHRFLTQAPPGMEVDHINHDTLDCRRSNLRVVTKAQNLQNLRPQARSSRSGIRNVAWNKDRQKWLVILVVNHKSHYFGLYSNLDEAAAVAQAARRNLMPHLDA